MPSLGARSLVHSTLRTMDLRGDFAGFSPKTQQSQNANDPISNVNLLLQNQKMQTYNSHPSARMTRNSNLLMTMLVEATRPLQFFKATQ